MGALPFLSTMIAVLANLAILAMVNAEMEKKAARREGAPLCV